MIIRRIALRNYRGVEDREIEFDNGVNVVEGPNEAGKTSLAEALRLIFEYPDSSTHRSVVATHPVHRDEGPEIDVELETGPYELLYHKRFKRRPETTLEVRRPRPESHTGRDAHARAEQILNETIDVALWRALQLQQGTAIQQADLRDREALARALDATSSAPGAEDGDERGALFDRVRDEYLRYFTETGRIRADRAEVRTQIDEISARLGELEVREHALANDVAEAERLATSLRELRARLPELESDATRLAAEWSAVLRRKEELERASGKAEGERHRADSARQAHERRLQLVEDAQAAATRRAELEKRIESEDAPLRRAELRWQSLCESEAQARAVLEAAEARLRSAQAAREIERGESELRRLLERIARVEEFEQELQTALETVKAIRVDDAGLRALQEAEIEVRQARARLEESGTRVEIRALEDTELQVEPSSQPDPPDAATKLERGATRSYVVEQELRLRIPESLEIRILESASSSSGESLRVAAERAVAQRERLLVTLGVSSLADAARAREEHERARQIAEFTRRNLEQALEGANTSELRAEAASLHDTLRDTPHDTTTRQLAASDSANDAANAHSSAVAADVAHATAPASDNRDPDVDALQLAAEERERAQAAFDQASALALRARSERETLRLDAMRLEGGVETAVAQSEALADRLDALRGEEPDTQLAERSLATARDAAAADERAKRFREQVAALDADRLEVLQTNAVEVVRAARTEEQQQIVALAGVTARLETQHEAGLFEEQERARARLSALTALHEARERRARAAARLYLEMCHQRERARQQYLQPLRERIERLGRIVFGPSFAVTLDAQLRIQSRTLAGRTVEFDSLSTGAQEQIGLLTRVAVAMTVTPEGGVPLVLDDALGNSDPLRLQSMGAMLAQAGRECQIIVLTCSPERFRHVGGAKFQRIAAVQQP